MKTTKKLSLNEIKVESFVTGMNEKEKETIFGGAATAAMGCVPTRTVCGPDSKGGFCYAVSFLNNFFGGVCIM